MLRVPSRVRFIVAAVGALVCGCSRPSYDVSGSVTFDGKPVEAGRIEFLPDAAKGGAGPTGHAAITGGKFDTRKQGLGHVGGPIVVRIEGFEIDPDNPKWFGKPLFPTYEIKIDMPKEICEKSFEVPAPAKALVSKPNPKS